MRHDYDLPAEWPAMSDSERSAWFERERARRQAKRQDTATSARRERARTRRDRRVEARSETVDLADNR